MAEAFRRSAEEGAEINIEFRVVWPDGSVHWLRDQGNVLRDAQGRPQSLAGACVDITERKAMETALAHARDELERRVEERTAELHQAQQRALQAERLTAIGQTVAGLAHEGRNALQTILASAQLLKWRYPNLPEALQLLDTIVKAHDTLHHLFEDVRGYASPIVLEPMICTLDEVWRKAWSQAVSGQAENKPIW